VSSKRGSALISERGPRVLLTHKAPSSQHCFPPKTQTAKHTEMSISKMRRGASGGKLADADEAGVLQ